MRVYLSDPRIPKYGVFEVNVPTIHKFRTFISEVIDYEAEIKAVSFDRDPPTLSFDCAQLLVEADMKYNILDVDFDFHTNALQTKNLLDMYLDS